MIREIAVMVGTVASLACVSIPREAPELSAVLGTRVAAMESAHIAMLRALMDEKRDRVDEFLMREWVPTFADELMQEPVIRDTWTAVCSSPTPADRLEFLRRLGPKVQAKINAKRLELIAPLDELERAIERRLRDEYGQMKAVNSAVTGFLASAAKVAENRDRFLGLLGITDKKLTAVIDQVDQAVSGLVDARDSAVDKVARFNEFKARLEAASTSIASDSHGGASHAN